MTLLMEDLIVLAVGLKPKAGPNSGVLPPQFRFGLRGAELVTLTMAGRVTVGNGRIEVRDATLLVDPLPNLALGQLLASGGSEVRSWMTSLPPLYEENYFERLRAAGALSQMQVRVLLMAKRTGYLVADQNYFHDVRMRLHAAVTSAGPIDPAQAALAGLVYAAGLATWAYPGAENAPVRSRLKQLAEGSAAFAPAGPGMRGIPEAAVQAVVSSVTEAVHAASQVSSHSHHGGGSGFSDSSPSHHHR